MTPRKIDIWQNAVKQVETLLSLSDEGRFSSLERCHHLRSLAGPYHRRSASGIWSSCWTDFLNRTLWRQHLFNQRTAALCLEQICGFNALLSSTGSGRSKILVIAPNDVIEPTTGGAARVHGLCAEWGKEVDVDIVCVTRWWKEPERLSLYPGVTIMSVPMSPKAEEAAQARQAQFGEASVLLTLGDPDISFPLFDELVRLKAKTSSAVILINPFLIERVRAVVPDKPLFCDLHDFLIDYIGRMAGSCREAALERLRQIESEALKTVEIAFVVSQEDAHRIEEVYPDARGKLCVVPNGVSCESSRRFLPTESRRLGRAFGLEEPVVAFLGSVLWWNIDAMQMIAENLAPERRHALWIVVGVEEDEFRRRSGCRTLPPNLIFEGCVAQSRKEAILALSTIAIAPMRFGTGSSLKIPDYVAHGKTVISTPIGVRGYPELESALQIVELDRFPEAIDDVIELISHNATSLDSSAAKAWEIVRGHYDWTVIAPRGLSVIQNASAKAS